MKIFFKSVLIATVLISVTIANLSRGLCEEEQIVLSASDSRVLGEIVVDFKDNLSTDSDTVKKLAEKYNLTFKYNSFFSEKTKITLAETDDSRIQEIAAQLSQETGVENAEPSYVYKIFGKINDPLYKYQWNFKKVNAEKAWKYSTGKGAVIAVIDTGAAYENHGKTKKLEDLEKTSFKSPYNFVNNSDKAIDDNGHGSHVAGTIAQTTNNGKGVAGLAFNATIMPVKVLNANGTGRSSDIAEGIRYAADKGANIINLSLGSRFPSKIIEDACQYACSKGCLLVCAAGNDNSLFPNFPAGCKGSISVSAVRDDNQLAFYSNKWSGNTIAAPGGDMNVDQNNDGYMDGILQNTFKNGDTSAGDYVLFQGTSMAAPHVSAVAALLWSRGIKNPETIKDIITKTAYTKSLNLKSGYGAGILDAGAALQKACSDANKTEELSKKPEKKHSRNVLLEFAAALILLSFTASIIGKRGNTASLPLSVLYSLGVFAGSCGLFFLPSALLEKNMALTLITYGFTDWFIPLGLSNQFAVLFFKSSFVPLLVLVLSMPFANFKRFALGFSGGAGCALLISLITFNLPAPILGMIPWAKQIWLLVNIILCFGALFGVFKFIPDPVKINKK